jgi:hypothetical protein
MKRWKRVLLEVLGPPAIGGMIVGIVAVVAGAWDEVPRLGWNRWMSDAAVYAVLILVGAYVVAGIPSLVFAGIMEWRFARGLSPASKRVVGWTGSLGLVSGWSIAFILAGNRPTADLIWPILLIGCVGAATGSVIGMLIRREAIRRCRDSAHN